MKILYQKSEICFAVAWIIAYCVLASMGDSLSASIGTQKIITLPILIVLSVFLILFVHKNHLSDKYGLCKSEIPASKMLFYIPLLALLTVNLWFGGSIHTSKFETVLYILSMMCVGFLEEMIFRGFLFCAMAAGFMFVMIFYKTKSLLPCIITHGVFNALSVFVNEAAMTSQRNIISCLFMVVISGAYALYIAYMIKPN